MSRSYFSSPTHSRAAGHQSIHRGFISRDMVFPHFLQVISTSSDQISHTVSHQKHVISSGYGVLISLLPGQLSLSIVINTIYYTNFHEIWYTSIKRKILLQDRMVSSILVILRPPIGVEVMLDRGILYFLDSGLSGQAG